MDDLAQSYFTLGYTSHLEPLPTLSYTLVSGHEDDLNRVDDEQDASHASRLEPHLMTSEKQTWPVIVRNMETDSFQAAARYWTRILLLLDSADADPQFSTLRKFFDARLTQEIETNTGPSQEKPVFKGSWAPHLAENESNAPERRSSFMSPTRRSLRWQWSRRPSLPSTSHARQIDLQVPPVPRAPPGSTLRGSRRDSSKQHSDMQLTDMYELWVSDRQDAESQCIRSNVRLDLHNVRLAPAPASLEKRHESRKKHSTPGFTMTRAVQERNEYPHSSTSMEEAQRSESSYRRSVVGRVLDRGLRKSAQASGTESGFARHFLPAGHDSSEFYVPENAVANDSDDELDRRDSEPLRSRSLGVRRGSTESSAGRSLGSAYVGRSELGPVEEDTNSIAHISSALRSTGLTSQTTPVSEDSRGSEMDEGEDLLTLLRHASSCTIRPGAQQNEPAWNRGQDDPLPSIVSYAMAQAFGWEGIMQLCYGPGSLCAEEQVFAPLGRAADLDSHMRQKYDAVLSWRNNVTGAGLEEEEANPTDTSPAPMRWNDDNDWSQAERSNREGDSSFASENHAVARIAKNNLGRTWKDWNLLFSSLFNWVASYETMRVHHGLAHEMGREVLAAKRPMLGRSRGPMHASPCVEMDALHVAHGFQRLPGVPEALRVGPQNDEHSEYRWARTELLSNQIQTPLIIATASAQFFMQQLSTSRWVFESGWELEYLNRCIFDSNMLTERFPAPGDRAVRSEHVYHPKPGELDISIPCPYPSTSGAWSAVAWSAWLSTIKEGHVLVPAVNWQAWWTLISVLNGADRTGRWYDLQVKTPNDTFDDLQHTSVYI
ncbi:hypothetical protein MYAM1_002259 [Malassezia yamatoensis]|uniref:Uncharacterized protein n=1 Tax=Malassezia yamatoensis TaxID=253288 RepID=A0AAJ5YSA4_9BASI|nr:hypothetical protein MYAM1_002259 [Malassezia yamatoensis]